MTDEMLELAHKNKAEAGVRNAEFLEGRIEDVPLPRTQVADINHVVQPVSGCAA